MGTSADARILQRLTTGPQQAHGAISNPWCQSLGCRDAERDRGRRSTPDSLSSKNQDGTDLDGATGGCSQARYPASATTT